MLSKNTYLSIRASMLAEMERQEPSVFVWLDISDREILGCSGRGPYVEWFHCLYVSFPLFLEAQHSGPQTCHSLLTANSLDPRKPFPPFGNFTPSHSLLGPALDQASRSSSQLLFTASSWRVLELLSSYFFFSTLPLM